MSIRAALSAGHGSRRGVAREFVAVLAGRDFRRLLSTRLVSQFGDGIFTAAIGTYVFFSQNSFPNPGVAATAFAVLYLPYSLIGPFAGVFIDRWSRRQILVWSALLRAALVCFTAFLVAGGSQGTLLYVSVLAALGVNRFFLSALSAALPHVVAEDELVMANAVAPTIGTICSFLGAVAQLGVHLAGNGGRSSSAIALLVAAGCYVLASAVGATMRRRQLGPPPLPPGMARAGLSTDLMMVVRGLASGALRAWRRRPVAAALGATAAQRAMYGILLLASILLYRNYFYTTSAANRSLGHFTLVVVAAAIGFGAAAVITPVVTRRVPKTVWIAVLLAVGGIVTGILGPTFSQPAFLAIALTLGIVAQGVAICSITIIQERMDDRYRGRVFALYDMLFNVPFVLGAVAAAQVIPVSGKSLPVVVAAAAGYLAAAAAYTLASRQELAAGPSPAPAGGSGAAPPDGGVRADPARPSDAAHRSSS
ncbi:MAG: MFS transporter [Actinobacteria bacterium]|nr:MFS transporter [Actinomycetota bacterium]